MKTPSNLAIRLDPTTEDQDLSDSFDQLVLSATAGDRRAIGALAIAFGPLLLKEAQQELGPLFHQDAGDVLQDFLLALAEARLSLPRIQGAAVPWMNRTVRSMARDHLRRRAAEWGQAG